jgi:hypothetical protein
MAEDSGFPQLERRVASIERSLEADRQRARDEVERARIERSRRRDQRERWVMGALWTLYVAALTTYTVLSATGNLHHH